jgi:hypothetical protein
MTGSANLPIDIPSYRRSGHYPSETGEHSSLDVHLLP